MFSVGDKIVYPMHGAGTVESIEKKKIGGCDKLYYNIHIISGNIKILLPVENQADVQLRPIISKTEAQEIIDEFDLIEPDEETTWNKRYKANCEKLRTGDITNVASVLKELLIRDHTSGLSTGDRKMLIQTKNIFFTEIALALDEDFDTLYEQLVSAIQG